MDEVDQSADPKLPDGDGRIVVPTTPRRRAIVVSQQRGALAPVAVGAMTLVAVGIALALLRLSERRRVEAPGTLEWMWRQLSAATQSERELLEGQIAYVGKTGRVPVGGSNAMTTS
jgi:hypothetical protein